MIAYYTGTTQGSPTLTVKEIAICSLVAEGLADKQIARKLNISYRTVELHIYRIKIKTGITSIAGLICFYLTQIEEVLSPTWVRR